MLHRTALACFAGATKLELLPVLIELAQDVGYVEPECLLAEAPAFDGCAMMSGAFYKETPLAPAVMIERPSWASLLEAAVREPGLVHGAYTQFHGYSLGNQILAVLQCTRERVGICLQASQPAQCTTHRLL